MYRHARLQLVVAALTLFKSANNVAQAQALAAAFTSFMSATSMAQAHALSLQARVLATSVGK